MVYTRIRLLLLIRPFLFNFSFSNIQTLKIFVTLFSGTVRPRRLKLGAHMDNGWMYRVYLNQAAAAYLSLYFFIFLSNFRVAERLALRTSDHGVAGSNPAGGKILPEPKRRFIAQSLSCSPFHRLEMTEILFKGRKTLTHPSISPIFKH